MIIGGMFMSFGHDLTDMTEVEAKYIGFWVMLFGFALQMFFVFREAKVKKKQMEEKQKADNAIIVAIQDKVKQFRLKAVDDDRDEEK